MDLLITSATILNPQSPFHQQKADLLIKNGIIAQIASPVNTNGEIERINAEGMYLSPGFFDLNCNIGELGLETKEDLQTGSRAAMAGGYTGLALMPNTQPPVHSKAEVQYLINSAKSLPVDVYPLGTISYKREGKDLAELYDMHISGAKGFSDGNSPVQNAGLMERALLYAQGFDGLIFSNPEDAAIAGQAKMHEGEVSTLLGMKGIPSLAEEIMISRDLYLAEYTNSKIHFSTVSTVGSVELIRQAKQKGLQVTCDVAAHHLVLTDQSLLSFDSNYKVKPPLRTQADVDALVTGLKDGTIDAIVSQHTPHEIEFKDVEFEIASFGIIALQTAFSLAVMAGLEPQLIAEKMSVRPRQILTLPAPEFTEGSEANFTLFQTEGEWFYNSENNASKSRNSPLLGHNLKGKILLTCNHNQVYRNL